ncbi:MAG: PAS-domain containing protein [Alphaproteobacteria bacterium]|nr:PAS-domain containing protein [Alphaproteobacteria bacterium]
MTARLIYPKIRSVTRSSRNSRKSFFSALFRGRKPPREGGDENARLQAFLAAFPGEYCGWGKDGGIVYSKNFCSILGLERISDFDAIHARLAPGDAAALEGLFSRLRQDGTGFTSVVKTEDEQKTLKITGSQGRDPASENGFDVLWVEDITGQAEAAESFTNEVQQKESQLQQMTAALSAIPRPLWLRDESQKIIWCNDTYAEFLNTTRDKALAAQKEIAAQTIKKKAASREKDELMPGKPLAETALKTGRTMETYVHVVVKGARILLRIMEIPLAPLPFTLGVAYNNTREEELETDLKRHQSSNRELLGQLRTAIGIYTADERLEFYNAAFAQLWDLEEQWLNTRPKLGEIMEKLRETRRLPEQADFKRFRQSWLEMFTSLIEPRDEMLHLPSGSALRMLVVPHSMGGLMMTFEDVTSRLELESSYNTLIAVQKETLDNLAESVAVYGSDGRLKLWNPSFGRLWKLHPEDLEGEPHITTIVDRMKGLFTKEEWPTRREELVAKGLDRLMHEGRLSRSDGALIDFTTVPLPDGGVLITYTDVTDTVRVENALRERNAALEAAEQLKLDFLANVSYQLRTPLNAIMGFTEILGQEYFGPLNERQKEYTRDMKDASERLLNLINDILDLSTLEAGYMKLEREDVDVGKMLSDVYELVTGWARKERVEITLEAEKGIGTIAADGRRLQQAIINLIRNSITFTPPGGRITLSGTRSKEGITIAVSDTGIGITQEDKNRIFAPFEKAQRGGGKPRLSRSGAGLGLSLVKNIIALHGGAVTLDSEPGQGTTVTLFLPYTSVKTNLKISA